MGVEPFNRMWRRDPQLITQHPFSPSSPITTAQSAPRRQTCQVSDYRPQSALLQVKGVRGAADAWPFCSFWCLKLTGHHGPYRDLDNRSHVLRMQEPIGQGAQVSDGPCSHHIESWVPISGLILYKTPIFHTLASLKLGRDLPLMVFQIALYQARAVCLEEVCSLLFTWASLQLNYI